LIKKALSKNGFVVLLNDKDITLPSGELVTSGYQFRNEFHLHPLSAADLFVPCGGRPASVGVGNIKKVYKEDGSPKWKVIVEGANLFFTQDARVMLERSGVVLYKDASANKGGVTSSSLEVLAALALSDEEHKNHMQVHDEKNIPEFYKQYVKDIQKAIEINARREFDCIWDEHVRTGLARCILTNKVSDKINELNDTIQNSNLFHEKKIQEIVLRKAIPPTLLKLVPLETVLKRVPENYTKAIF